MDWSLDEQDGAPAIDATLRLTRRAERSGLALIPRQNSG
jgi:hypothetical protein